MTKKLNVTLKKLAVFTEKTDKETHFCLCWSSQKASPASNSKSVLSENNATFDLY